jgi:hypothetical protein
VSKAQPEKPTFWFWLLVTGAVLALPVAVLTTCQVRVYEHPPGVYSPVGQAFHDLASILIGIVIGAAIIAALVRIAGRLPHGKPPGGNQPQPGRESFPSLPADWQSPWREPPKGPDPSVRPADSPVREPPQGDQ